ncbi:ribosome maturation factor RimM [Cognatilysobacter lacus]|uniref:Ribosome maturation factor RimM n=1 Tax=Cognatilysobacter lacus TaxID=1643323 RepID=A0A5D8Z271_9GAMM|nr:ribosome maturation factor RimM [Lysobacter lacus]TZF88750.1 ribosome maturation factor RimM [Lysobacter lacus]
MTSPVPGAGGSDTHSPGRRILVGRVVGAFGVRGEVKIESWTEPRSAILGYRPWTLRDARGGERELIGVRGRETAKGVVAELPGVDDRDAAEAMRGTEIYVARAVLPKPAQGEVYWVDLEGLQVVNVDGRLMGRVSHVFPTGANDVLVAREGDREWLIPFVRPQYVTDIDLDAGRVTVDWDPDF